MMSSLTIGNESGNDCFLQLVEFGSNGDDARYVCVRYTKKAFGPIVGARVGGSNQHDDSGNVRKR
jgi:hypothetical protein